MAFWIFVGLTCIIPSVVFIALRRKRKKRFVDTPFTKIFDWPLVITGVMFLIPGWIWWDITVGLVAAIAWEVYKFMVAKRKHAEHDLAQATASKREVA